MRNAIPLMALIAGCTDGCGDKGSDPDGDPTTGEAPTATLRAPTDGGPWYSDQPIALAGTVSDAEDAPARLTVRWATEEAGDLGIESPVGDDGAVTGSALLEDGTHTLVLEVTDTDGNTGSDAVTLTVGGPNHAPECGITAPEDGAAGAVGDEVVFSGTATDPDVSAEQLTVVWSSDLDGELRSSTPDPDGSVAFATRDLSIGTHRIRLLVTDETGATCGESRFLTVGSPPALTLDTPLDGARVNEGEPIAFTGTVSDGEDRPEDLSLRWTSSLDGEFSTTPADSSGALDLSVDELQAGVHDLEVTVTDTDGLYAVDRRTLTVNALPTTPTVTLSPDPAFTTDALVATATDSTDPDASGSVTYAYAWTEDGAALSETSATLPASATTKGRSYRVTVTPSDDLGAGPPAAAERTVDNSDPVLTGPTLSASTVQVGDTLTCGASAVDDDPADSPTVSYAWHDGSSGPTFTVTEADDPGDRVICTATADDGDGGIATASASATVANTDPVLTGPSVSPATGQVGDVLTCAATATDADGGSPALTTTWPDSSTASTYTIVDTDDPGDTITCTATASDADGGAVSGTASATVTNTDPVLGAVSISPATAHNDDTLTCGVTATDADGGSPTVTVAWEGSVVGSLGSSASLDLSATAAASLEVITCTATAADTDGGSDSAAAAITLDNRAPTVSVALTPGSAGRGDTLTCTATAADDDGDVPSTSFTWTVSGGAATATTTSPTDSTLAGAFSQSDTVVCAATTTDGKGGSATDSAGVTIANTAPSLTSLSLTPSTVYTDDTLRVSLVASDADGDSVSVTYDWYVAGSLVQSGTDDTLDGASATVGFDRGEAVFAVVTASDGIDTTSSTTATRTIANTPPTAPAVAIDPSDPSVAEDLLCEVTTASTDADGDTITYAMEWTVDGASYAAGGSADTGGLDSGDPGWAGPTTTTWTDDTADGDDTLAAETWTCEAVPDDGTDEGASGTASASICHDDADCDGSPSALDCDDSDPAVFPVDDDGDGVADRCGWTVSAGEWHTCGLDSTGTAACWGGDWIGQASPPTGTFTSISAGDYHNCALDSGGSMSCWGDYANGQTTPPSGVTFASVSAGGWHNCYFDTSGALDCWGYSAFGQTTAPAGPFETVDAGQYHNCALDAAGSISCWGNNAWGQTTSPAGSFEVVVAGGYHNCALDAAGALDCWGWNNHAQSSPPSGAFQSVSTGEFHNCAIDLSGQVACWGRDNYGQATPPTGVFQSVSAGSHHTCGVDDAGAVQCWGENRYGQSTPPP